MIRNRQVPSEHHPHSRHYPPLKTRGITSHRRCITSLCGRVLLLYPGLRGFARCAANRFGRRLKKRLYLIPSREYLSTIHAFLETETAAESQFKKGYVGPPRVRRAYCRDQVPALYRTSSCSCRWGSSDAQ